MKKLNVLVFRSYLGPLAFTFAIALFLLIMQMVWKWIDELVGKGLETDIIIELLTYTSARLVRMSLILAILLSSIMTFGNLGENYELVAIKSSGISLIRVMLPLIIFHLILSVGAFCFANYVEPIANLKFFTLLRDVREQQPEFNLREGAFNNDIQGYSIKFSQKSRNSNMLYNIMIYDHTDNKGNKNMTRADSGTIVSSPDKRQLIVNLYNGINTSEEIEKTTKRNAKRYPFRRDEFKTQQLVMSLPGNELERSSEEYYKNLYMMLNLSQLKHNIDSLYKMVDQRQDYYIRRHLNKKYNKNGKVNNQQANDTSNLKLVFPAINSDSLFNSYDLNNKKQIIQTASITAGEARIDILDSRDRMQYRKKIIHRHEIEWHKKFTMSIACLLFFFIGAPLGAIIRKGGIGMPVVISVFFFLVYYIVSITGEKYARVGVLPSTAGMWLSTILIVPIGFMLTYKATRDSGMMNIDYYILKIRKIFKLKRKTK